MQRNQKPQCKGNAQPRPGNIELDHRYGRIGISAVRAAVQRYGERRKPPGPDSLNEERHPHYSQRER